MSATPASDLERKLSELTTWEGPAPELWRRALDTPGRFRRRAQWLSGRRVPLWLWGSLAAAVILLAIGYSAAPELSAAREYPRAPYFGGAARDADVRARRVQAGPTASEVDASQDKVILGTELAQSPGPNDADLSRVRYESVGERAFSEDTAGKAARQEADSASGGERRVVRKATIELATKDVRAAFAKASLLISEAQGEYVQESSLTGSGNRTEANLTLRIAVQRLSEVLNELRQLGNVRAETSGGEDVTSQAVDLEARLRNEQRVEAELLQLLEKRNDAPLKEILELRQSLSGVRQTIEQLTAQRERLDRLVALATVLVIIRPADAPSQPTALAAYFSTALHTAWYNGVRFLARTIGGLLSVLVGGLIWWVLLIIVLLIVRAYRRRGAAAPANSPARTQP